MLVVAHELGDRPLLLDPIEAATWNLLDGEWSVAEIVEDLADALGGDPQAHHQNLQRLLGALSHQQLLSDSVLPDGLVPRLFRPRLEPSNCIGKRIGLGRSTYGQLTVGDTSFLFGATEASTVREILDRLPAAALFTDADRDGLDAFILRETSGRTARVQQLLDGFGNVRWIGTDVAEARRALGATVAVFLPASDRADRVLIDGPILRTDAGAAIVHPALRDIATSIMRSDLRSNGVSFLPTALAVFHPAGTTDDRPALEVPGLGSGPASEVIPLNGIILPGPILSRADAVVSAAHVVHRWDDAGLAAALRLVERLPIGVVQSGAPGSELFTTLCDASWGRL